LIRVLPGQYPEQPNNLSTIVASQVLYFVHFPLKESLKQGIVRDC